MPESLGVSSSCLFSSDQYPDNEKTDAVRAIMSPFFDMQPIDKSIPVSGRMDISLFGQMVFSKTEFSNHKCERDTGLANLSGLDSILIQLFSNGNIKGNIGNHTLEVPQGSIVAFDLSKSYNFQITESVKTECLNIVIPRVLLEKKATHDIHGKLFRSQERMTKIISSYMRGLSDVIHEMDNNEILAAQQMTIDMLNSGFSILTNTNSDKEIDIKEKIIIYIKKSCQDSLEIDHLLSKFHISRATLFRLFSQEGGVVSYINDIRLQGFLKDLIFHKKEASISALTQTWGFSSEQQLIRLFKAKYGQTPFSTRDYINKNTYKSGFNDLYGFLSVKSRK